MGEPLSEDLFSQIEEHLKCSEQSWLMGAGISFDAKLPLMHPLTNKVKKDVESKYRELFDEIIKINKTPTVRTVAESLPLYERSDLKNKTTLSKD